MSAVLDGFFGIHAHALNIWSKRTEYLAANIANADTPNYKAKDVDFQTLLENQADSESTVFMNGTQEGHIAMQNGKELFLATGYRAPLQSSLDGNTVDSQIEHSMFAENALRHQISMHFLSSRISGLVRTLREE